jgi:hypothetical protein
MVPKVVPQADGRPRHPCRIPQTLRGLRRTSVPRAKELLFVLSLAVLKAGRHHIAGLIHTVLRIGVSPREILKAIKIAPPEAGVVAFQHGFGVWREVMGVTRVEPRTGVLPDG